MAEQTEEEKDFKEFCDYVNTYRSDLGYNNLSEEVLKDCYEMLRKFERLFMKE